MAFSTFPKVDVITKHCGKLTREGPLDFDIMMKDDSFLDKFGNGVSENLVMDEKNTMPKGIHNTGLTKLNYKARSFL